MQLVHKLSIFSQLTALLLTTKLPTCTHPPSPHPFSLLPSLFLFGMGWVWHSARIAAPQPCLDVDVVVLLMLNICQGWGLQCGIGFWNSKTVCSEFFRENSVQLTLCIDLLWIFKFVSRFRPIFFIVFIFFMFVRLPSSIINSDDGPVVEL